MRNEKDLAKIAEGKIANNTYQGMAPYFEAQKKDLWARLLNTMRSGDLDLQKFVAIGAQAVTIDDMENALRQKIRLADSLAKREDSF